MKSIATAIALAAIALPTCAQTVDLPAATSLPVPAADTAIAVSTPQCCAILAGTVIRVELSEAVGTKANVRGDRFGLVLIRPIVVDDQVLVPAGAIGVGEVVHAARAGFAGKAPELLLAGRYIIVGDDRVPIRGLSIAVRGDDESGTAMALSVALPLAGLLVRSGEIEARVGTQATAKITNTFTVTPPALATAPHASSETNAEPK